MFRRLSLHPAAAPVLSGLLWLGPFACAIGLIAWRMDRAWPGRRIEDSLLIAAVSLALAALLRRWRGGPWAYSLASVWTVALVFFCGVLPVAATAGLAIAAAAVGSGLVPAAAPGRAVLAVPVGLALIAGVDGWLLPVPLHRPIVYGVVFLALIALRRRALRDLAREIRIGIASAVDAAPMLAAIAVVLLGLVSTAAWLPTAQGDDLAYHLALPSELARHGVYSLDPTHQIWALAPWLGDVVHGIAEVLAGREARGPVDLFWVVIGAAASWRIATALEADARTAWCVVAVFLTLPLLAALTAGMQTELPATALVLSLALAILLGREGALVPAVGVLAGALVALKLGHAVAAAVLLVWAAMRSRLRFDMRRLPWALFLFLLVAGSSYVYAGVVSGNPLLPLFNDVFASPVLPPRQLDDPRWHAGFGWTLPWSITFDTSRYLEADPGGFGFVLVFLAGAWVIALMRPATRGLAIGATLIAAFALVPMQYARYAFPGVALLVPPLIVAARGASGARGFAAFAFALCALDLAYQANASGSLSSVARRRFATSGGNPDEVFRRFAPERMLIAEVRDRDRGDPVVLALDPDFPHVAELAPHARSVAWYDPPFEKARQEAERDGSGEEWRRLIEAAGAHWLLLRPASASAALRAGLAREGAVRVDTVGVAELWQSGNGAASTAAGEGAR